MEEIKKGAFQIARQLFSSEIWLEKPSTWKIIWIYILGKVNHKKNGKFDRGEGFFNFAQEHKLIGIDITVDMVRHFLGYARKSGMLSTSRSTRGTIIKVLKYNTYQTLNNFQSTTKSTIKARRKHEGSTRINKNDKNVKNEKNYNIISSEQARGTEINKLLKYFYELNPTFNFGNTTQRKAIVEIISKFGFKKTEKTIQYAISIQGEKYSPTITTPIQLKNKLGDLLIFYKKNKQNSPLSII